MRVDVIPDAIRLVRVSHRLSGAPGLRLGLERWLADCDPSKHGLPSQAIVLVRRLHARWSDVVDDDRSLRYGTFSALLDGARRPAAGDADADVVWFADEAELLACIARDALSGALRTRWWWCLLAPAAMHSSPGVARWLQAPRQIPRAVQGLGVARATAWFASWTMREQALMVSSLEQVFTVSPSVAAWVLEGTVRNEDVAPVAVASKSSKPVGTETFRDDEVVATSAAERLHQLCAELAEDAGAARVPEQAARMATRLAAHTGRLPPQGLQPADAVRSVVRRAALSPASAGTEKASSTGLATAAGPATIGTDHIAAHETSQPPLAQEAVRTRLPPPRDEGLPSPTLQRSAIAAAPNTASIDPGEALADSPVRTCIDTRFGGLFFVLNAALQLSLYGDFTMPSHTGLPCSPWRFLSMAGRVWCGASFRNDPLARWLGRRDASAERPRVVRSNTDWRLDAAWLEPFEGSLASWHACWQDGRFRLTHPAGFRVCDVASTADECEALIAREAARLGMAIQRRMRRSVIARRAGAASRSSAPRQSHGCPAPLWPYLHTRLALALDDGDATAARRRVASMLKLPARLEDYGERMDLHIPLEALPLSVRLAGLDRDPGWIPAAGCDFRFHFG